MRGLRGAGWTLRGPRGTLLAGAEAAEVLAGARRGVAVQPVHHAAERHARHRDVHEDLVRDRVVDLVEEAAVPRLVGPALGEAEADVLAAALDLLHLVEAVVRLHRQEEGAGEHLLAAHADGDARRRQLPRDLLAAHAVGERQVDDHLLVRLRPRRSFGGGHGAATARVEHDTSK
eukprot:6885698-Prymnesium_polylepis.1